MSSTSAGLPHPPEPPPHALPPRRSKLAIVVLVLAMLPVVSYAACETGALSNDEGAVAWIASCVLSIVGAIAAAVNAVRLGGKTGAHRPYGRTMSIVAAVVGFLSPVVTFLIGFFSMEPLHGRPFIRRGRARKPRLAHAPEWCADIGPLDGDPRHATKWREMGLTEYASVPAFEELATHLERLGAPRSLIDGAYANARDEVEHARVCFGIARALDGRALGPGAFPEALEPAPLLTHAELFERTAREGCVHERACALALGEMSTRALDPTIRAALARLSRDEHRHADHADAVLDWLHGCTTSVGRQLAAAATDTRAQDC
jgi:hypothetical protein